jgi:serine/threonine protein kinase/tetratricopeptide (TPR) repeat protein
MRIMADPQRVRSIFLEPVENHAPEQWRRFLDQACGEDHDLRKRIEVLLRAHDQANSMLDVAAVSPAATTDEPITEGPGTVIGPYKLLEQIGEGGFGVVFMAEQTGPVRRKVALKVLKPGMDTRQVVARFEAERQALAIMDHPNIAKVFDGGATPSGRPYFVMELVKGVPITDFCDQNQLTPRQRLVLFIPVCQAVQHAHQKGIIHRDLKPSNVLVTVHDVTPVAKVIDFGVSKALGQELTDKTLFTGFAQMVGTPVYMSPEQAGQSGLDVDTRSDIYSLGVLLYELLTGTTPFTKERFKKAAYDEIRRIIREEEPPKPSTRLSQSKDSLPAISAQRHTEPVKLKKLVRGELDWIVMKALEKDRKRRYETANGLAMDLQRYLADEPVQACPPSAGYRLRKFARKHRGAVTAVALIVAALTAGVAGTSIGLIRAMRAERLATERLVEVTDERNRAAAAAAEAHALNDFLTQDLLGQADPDRNAPHKKVTVEELLRRAEQRIDRNPRFAGQPAVAATLHITVAQTYTKLGLLPEAERHFRLALAGRREALGPNQPETLAAQEALADFLNRSLLRPEESEPLAKETWEARARVLGPEDPDTLDSLDTYAIAVHLAGRKREALDLNRRCLEARIRTLGREHEQTLISMNNVANQMGELGDRHEALPLLREVLAIRKAAGRKSELASSVYNLVIVLDGVGELVEADSLVTEYADWAVQELGAETPAADKLAGLAVRIWVDRGRRLDDAVERGRKVLAHRRKAYPAGHFFTGMVLLDLGRAQVLRGELEAAKRDLDEADHILRNVSARLPPFWLPWVQCWRGICLTRLERYADAEPLLLEAEGALRAGATTPAGQHRTTVENLVALYEKWGRPTQAAEWRKKLPQAGPQVQP